MTGEELRRLGLLADTLDRSSRTNLGPPLRRLIREYQTLAAGGELEPAGCPRCHRPVIQLGRGRPRIYCSDECRWARPRKSHEMRRSAA